jgi:hypothetical protein
MHVYMGIFYHRAGSAVAVQAPERPRLEEEIRKRYRDKIFSLTNCSDCKLIARTAGKIGKSSWRLR